MPMRLLYAACFPVLFMSAALGAQRSTLPLWPGGTPEPAQTSAPQANVATPEEIAKAGYPMVRLSNVTAPALAVYPPSKGGNGTAALVFPGGGYRRLAMDIEGIDTCRWLNSVGITCVLVTYRVPEQGYYPENPADLEDAQQAMRLTRAHAREWHIDPQHIGVVGFSAGGNLAVLMSTHPDDAHVMSTPAATQVPRDPSGKPLDARAAFAVVVYPAYLAVAPAMRELNPVYTPDANTPPTFVIQAEDDKQYGARFARLLPRTARCRRPRGATPLRHRRPRLRDVSTGQQAGVRLDGIGDQMAADD